MREKLVEIIQNSVGGCARHWAEVIADGLIAHGATVLDEPIKMVIPEGVDEKALIEMIRNAPIQILPGEPVQEWISVKDRLPEKDKRVIAFKSGMDRSYIFLAKRFSDKWFDVEWNVYRYGVTHWMPLPQPPKGE